MASPSSRLVVLTLCTFLFPLWGSCLSFRSATPENYEFPVLKLERRASGSNLTSPNNSTATPSWVCKFTTDYLIQAAETNCSAYIAPVESSIALLPWERYDSIKSFANCTYRQVALRFPDIPDGIPTLVFRDGQLFFTPKPNMVDARTYVPPPPIDSSILPSSDQVTTTVPFLPVLKDATEPFLRAVKEGTPGACSAPVNSSYNAAATQGAFSEGALSLGFLLHSIEITTQQYTRCTVQSSSDIGSCTTSAVSKLDSLPPAMFIYFGASQCDSKLWSFLGVAFSIVLDFLHIAALMFFQDNTLSFSWLQFLIKLASGLGEPAIQAALLQKANRDDTASTGFVLAAMEFLQPTAAPLVSFVAGWWFSKGHGFQVLATDAITTLLGVVMISAFTTMQLAIAAITQQTKSLLVPVGLLCAVTPWLLTYVLFGLVSLPMQIGFFLGMVELFLQSETTYGFELFGFCLGVLLIVVGFVAATPLFAIWEAIWVALQWNKKRKAKKQAENSEREEKVEEEKALFPLARWFRGRFQNTSRIKRGLVKFLFWLFVVMSLASFVGKWMFMVNLLNFADDAYCPSGYKEATFAGLGFKAGVLSIGVVLQFFGLTA